MAKNLFLVLTNPIEGQDDAFNEWYDTKHVPEVLDVPGVIAAQRYDLAQVTVPADEDLPAQLPPPTHRYLVVYELDRDPDAVMKEFLARVTTGKLSLGETLDLSTISLTGWTPHGERRVADHNG
ncbi:DUF4286 family protein [Mycobacterium xenopi]|uniref:DUF4286 family protein n=1 Tax=Mycobacterium xenopi TaxID=1789 RepID=UPI0004530CE1|nr:DUF4286 family protein [Mycobacterium xenopi]EUA51303.1 hypothetical protein I552_2244 [Mycobacterium xenopi 3993]MDA3640565.1 hypothetical protein [Mycobacterium xenopi]MDA3658013.1 hypothetical protein [Mycobacterium xenopi]MDA3662605.1 hypothetical protein [Mycobacterium xenopi]ORX15279.1 hypothetical protein AWC32_13940 [Mycobacterium xenopi]